MNSFLLYLIASCTLLIAWNYYSMMQECDQETIRIIMPKQAGPLKGQLAVEVIPFARQPMKKAQNLFVSTQLAIPILIQFMRSRKIDPK